MCSTVSHVEIVPEQRGDNSQQLNAYFALLLSLLPGHTKTVLGRISIKETMTESEKSETKEGNKPAPKEKIRSIMEAASALTALGEEESDASRPGSPSGESKKEDYVNIESKDTETPGTFESAEDEEEKEAAKRYLPDHKKPDAAPTFPEKVSHDPVFLCHFVRRICTGNTQDGGCACRCDTFSGLSNIHSQLKFDISVYPHRF
jgi:cell division protein FtsN